MRENEKIKFINLLYAYGLNNRLIGMCPEDEILHLQDEELLTEIFKCLSW